MAWLVTHMWMVLVAAAVFALILGWTVRGILLTGRMRKAIVDKDIALTELDQARDEIERLFAAQRAQKGEGSSVADNSARKIADLNAELQKAKTELASLKSAGPKTETAEPVDADAPVIVRSPTRGGPDAPASDEFGAPSDAPTGEGDEPPSLVWRNRHLEARVQHLEAQLADAAVAAVAAADAVSDEAADEAGGEPSVDEEGIAKLKWQVDYLKQRVEALEAELARVPEPAPEPAPAPAEDVSEEMARLRWRNRFLEGRLAYFEGGAAEAAAAAADEVAGEAVSEEGVEETLIEELLVEETVVEEAGAEEAEPVGFSTDEDVPDAEPETEAEPEPEPEPEAETPAREVAGAELVAALLADVPEPEEEEPAGEAVEDAAEPILVEEVSDPEEAPGADTEADGVEPFGTVEDEAVAEEWTEDEASGFAEDDASEEDSFEDVSDDEEESLAEADHADEDVLTDEEYSEEDFTEDDETDDDETEADDFEEIDEAEDFEDADEDDAAEFEASDEDESDEDDEDLDDEEAYDEDDSDESYDEDEDADFDEEDEDSDETEDDEDSDESGEDESDDETSDDDEYDDEASDEDDGEESDDDDYEDDAEDESYEENDDSGEDDDAEDESYDEADDEDEDDSDDVEYEGDEEVVAERPMAMDGPVEGHPDDLTLIGGIGPKIQVLLNELGIWHYDQIAAWSPENVAWVDHHLNFNGRITREGWVSQAAVLVGDAENA